RQRRSRASSASTNWPTCWRAVNRSRRTASGEKFGATSAISALPFRRTPPMASRIEEAARTPLERAYETYRADLDPEPGPVEWHCRDGFTAGFTAGWRAASRAALAEPGPAEWVMAPRVPTERMLYAAWVGRDLTPDMLRDIWRAMITAAPPLPARDDGWRPTHRHVKRGTTYRAVTMNAKLLADEPQAGYAILTIYHDEHRNWWARPTREFTDPARFMPLPPPPTQVEQAGATQGPPAGPTPEDVARLAAAPSPTWSDEQVERAARA